MVKNRKSEHHHGIMHIRITFETKFQIKLRILIFCNKFAHKGFFWFEIEKVNNTIEFSIFK